MKDRTSLVIAHRLTTIERCGRVVVVDDGKIVESGKFKDLQNKQDGYFASMVISMKKKESTMEEAADPKQGPDAKPDLLNKDD